MGYDHSAKLCLKPSKMMINIHPELQPFVGRAKQFPVCETVTEMRQAWRTACLWYVPARPASLRVEDRTLTFAGVSNPIRIYRPSNKDPLPAVIYFHGGGWVLGDLDTNDTVAWGLAEGTGAMVISVDYRLAPEHPYPAAFTDCCNAVGWIREQAADLGLDPYRLALCGDSAGGNLAAAVSLAARDQGQPPFVAQALIYPVLGRDTNLPSYQEWAAGPGLTQADMVWYLDAYLGPDWSQADAYALPFLASDLANLPPTLVHTAEIDPLRDEGKLFAQRLEQAGVPVTYRCARQMVHGFIRARLEGPALITEFQVIVDFLQHHLFDTTQQPG